jgi:hypothetical protein
MSSAFCAIADKLRRAYVVFGFIVGDEFGRPVEAFRPFAAGVNASIEEAKSDKWMVF